jgi:hypothetical protein
MVVACDDGALWMRTWPDPTRWIVIDRDARLLHRIKLPIEARILHATRDRAWIAESDSSGAPVVTRYRVRPADPLEM